MSAPYAAARAARESSQGRTGLTISGLIEVLQEIQRERGDLLCQSSYMNEVLTRENIKVQTDCDFDWEYDADGNSIDFPEELLIA